MALKLRKVVGGKVLAVALVDKRKIAPLLFLFIILGIGFNMSIENEQKRKSLKFCFNFPWRNLHPGTQNTLIGGLIISQQFESLVKIDQNGNVVPSLAKSWFISDDFKKIKFKLDETKKFQNGKSVTAHDVLSSWEKSLSMSKEGPNNSLKDVLYNLEGWNETASLKNIKGFKVLNETEFELQFKTPFRLAIYHLRGARFSIYTEDGDGIFGSGRYKYDVYSRENEIELMDTLNELNFNISVKPPGDGTEIVQSGHCDILYSPQGALSKNVEKYSDVEHVESEDAVHLILTLNTRKGIFKDVRMRKAFLSMIFSTPEISQAFVGNSSLNTADPQIYNVLSQGRLKEDEAVAIIGEGREWVEEFKKKISDKNLSFLINDTTFLKPAFEKLKIDPYIQNKKVDSSVITKFTYAGTLEEDFTAGFISVLSFDPDGIYHALGRNGAILNPYMANEKIFELLEEGRQITDLNALDEHYKNVSRKFLTEVPFIHLGFSKNMLMFNKTKVQIGIDRFRNTLDFRDFKGK